MDAWVETDATPRDDAPRRDRMLEPDEVSAMLG